MSHGGKRPGAGRPPKADAARRWPVIGLRLPPDLADEFRELADERGGVQDVLRDLIRRWCKRVGGA